MARSAFRYSLWVFLVGTVLVGVTFLPSMQVVLESQKWHWLVQLFGGVIGIAVALTGSFIYIGMLIHCLGTTKLKWVEKVMWACALLIATLVAAIFYYFAVYAAKDKASLVQ